MGGSGEKNKKKKQLWDLELTFLLSSISCSNMALNTGERAGKKTCEKIKSKECVMAAINSEF